jgi:hypothetical protein
MPDNRQPEWKEIVRKHLTSSDLPHCVEEEITAELAAHLEEVYEEAVASASSETEATRLALDQVEDWRILAAVIMRARSKEASMNCRTKTIWLPAIGILFGIGLFLLFTDRAAILQRCIWAACMALLLCAAASERNRLNLRTRSLWLPGFATLTAASLFLFGEEILLMHDSSFYFTSISLRPSQLVSGLPLWFYLAWLLAQVFCGALGAFLSRRSGGTRVARTISGAFPALVMFGLCAIAIPVSALFEHHSYVLHHPLQVALVVFIWAGAPGIALLAGAVPFLRDAGSSARAAA